MVSTEVSHRVVVEAPILPETVGVYVADHEIVVLVVR
jgi:hypothetical protein